MADEETCDATMLPKAECPGCRSGEHINLNQDVLVTKGGNAYHVRADCPALADGQAQAERLGANGAPA